MKDSELGFPFDDASDGVARRGQYPQGYDEFDFWTAPPRRPRSDSRYGPPAPQYFKLAPHHRLVLSGYQKRLIKGEPGAREGFPVLCSPAGLPVVRLHGDLRPGEVSWVIR